MGEKCKCDFAVLAAHESMEKVKKISFVVVVIDVAVCLCFFYVAVVGVFLVACTVASGFKHTQLALFISLARDTDSVRACPAHLLGTQL